MKKDLVLYLTLTEADFLYKIISRTDGENILNDIYNTLISKVSFIMSIYSMSGNIIRRTMW